MNKVRQMEKKLVEKKQKASNTTKTIKGLNSSMSESFNDDS